MSGETKRPELISTGEAARACGVSTQTIGNWIRQGRLRAATTGGGRFRVHADSLQALLDSYRLIQSDADMALASSRSVTHHNGGAFRGSVYHNDIYGVELQGPEGWQTQQRAGGAAFRAVWTSPHGSRLWITGYAVPPGMNHWCQKTADRWLQQLCENAGLVQGAAGPSWTDHGVCGSMRSVVCTPRIGKTASSHQRPMRVLMRDDLLVIADGCVATDDDAAPLEAALGSLRLTK